MPVEVIGAGFPRTGTSSLQKALEILGYGVPFHMWEVLKDPALAKKWAQAHKDIKAGKEVDWEEVTKGFRAGVDAPFTDAWKELAEAYPEAKVIFTYRDPESWINSINATVGNVWSWQWGFAIYWVPVCYWQRQMCFDMQNRYEEQSTCHRYHVSLMDKRLEECKLTLPADRLLVFQAKDGWAPLCKFLNKPIPDVPYPNINETKALNARLGEWAKEGLIKWAFLFAGVVAVGTAIGTQSRLLK